VTGDRKRTSERPTAEELSHRIYFFRHFPGSICGAI
jgi:hypothetical protein